MSSSSSAQEAQSLASTVTDIKETILSWFITQPSFTKVLTKASEEYRTLEEELSIKSNYCNLTKTLFEEALTEFQVRILAHPQLTNLSKDTNPKQTISGIAVEREKNTLSSGVDMKTITHMNEIVDIFSNTTKCRLAYIEACAEVDEAQADLNVFKTSFNLLVATEITTNHERTGSD
jgi:hypothetical protein